VTTTTGDAVATAQIQGSGSCNDTAPIAGKVTGGPAPYWQSYSYDTLGDRYQEINHDTSVTSTANNVTQTLSYNGYSAATGTNAVAANPNAVTSTSTTGPTGTTTSNYAYFNNGAVKTRTGQSFTYTPQGQTATVTNNGSTSTYTYDATGNLLLQNDPAANQTILHLPWGEELTLNTGNGAVTGQRYYTESPDGLIVVRNSNGTISYEGDTPQGTATLEVNAATLAYTFRYFDPYGNKRGTTPTSWPDQHSYLGQPQDPTTSLDLLGARQYDPVTGRFLSVDPILETGDQRQMNGYSYAADNPVNGSDPKGTRFQCPSGDSGCNSSIGNGGNNCANNSAQCPPPYDPCAGGACNGTTNDQPVTISKHVLAKTDNATTQLLIHDWSYIIAQFGDPGNNIWKEQSDWIELCGQYTQACEAAGLATIFDTTNNTGFGTPERGIKYLAGGILLTGVVAAASGRDGNSDEAPQDGTPQVRSLNDPESMRGASFDDVADLAKAAGLEAAPLPATAATGGWGVRYYDPANKNIQVMVERGDPANTSSEVVHQGPYLKYQFSGRAGGTQIRVPLEGNPYPEWGDYSGAPELLTGGFFGPNQGETPVDPEGPVE
jgi:RHS repeat-associated protein